jgi:hypothetical protein
VSHKFLGYTNTRVISTHVSTSKEKYLTFVVDLISSNYLDIKYKEMLLDLNHGLL